MSKKDWKKVRKAALDQGWTAKSIKDGEMLFPPDKSKSPVTVHGTPSDRRAFANTLAEMRRQGLVWPWPLEKGRR